MSDHPTHVGVRVISWGLRILLSIFFLVAMYRKLNGDALPMATFEALGVGQWFRILTGLLEGAGAIGLLFPQVALFAAIGLAFVMIGAIATHWFVIGGSALLAIVLFFSLMGTAYLSRMTRNM